MAEYSVAEGRGRLSIAFTYSLAKSLLTVQTYLKRLLPDFSSVEVLTSDATELRDLGRRLLFTGNRGIAAIQASQHPFWNARFGDFAANDATASLIKHLTSPSGDHIKVAEQLSDAQGDVVVIGGPVSSIYSRLILGAGESSPLLASVPPVSFGLREPLLKGKLRQNADGSGALPDWDLLRDRLPIKSDKDFLLITSLPHFYSEFNERLINVAGRRGGGTRAIGLVLSRPRLLDRLYRRTRGMEAWQALFVVESDGETPYSVSDDPEVFPIRADFELLHRTHAGKPLLSDVEDVEFLASATATSRWSLVRNYPAATQVLTKDTYDPNNRETAEGGSLTGSLKDLQNYGEKSLSVSASTPATIEIAAGLRELAKASPQTVRDFLKTFAIRGKQPDLVESRGMHEGLTGLLSYLLQTTPGLEELGEFDGEVSPDTGKPIEGAVEDFVRDATLAVEGLATTHPKVIDRFMSNCKRSGGSSAAFLGAILQEYSKNAFAYPL